MGSAGDGPQFGRPAGPAAGRVARDRRLGAGQTAIEVERRRVAPGASAAVACGPVLDRCPGARVGAALNLPAVIGDRGVGGAVDLQYVHRMGRLRAFHRLIRSGQTRDGRDRARVVVRQPVRHEGAVGVPEDEDALLVDPILRLDLVDEAGQIGRVVELLPLPVAAGGRRVPEPRISRTSRRCAVRGHHDEPVGVSQCTEAHVLVLPCAGVAVGVQQHDERRRRVAGIAGRHGHGQRTAAGIDRLGIRRSAAGEQRGGEEDVRWLVHGQAPVPFDDKR